MYRGLLGLVVLVLLSVAACDDGEDLTAPTTPQELTGFWIGEIAGLSRQGTLPGTGTADTARFEIVELALTQDTLGRVSGAGAFRARTGSSTRVGTQAPAPSRAFQASGTNAYPDVVLLLEFGTVPSGNRELVYFRGEFRAADVIDATLHGAGFASERVRLRRNGRPFLP